MGHRCFRSYLAVGGLVAGVTGVGTARAALVIVNSAVGGGAPVGPGITYENFDTVPLGSTGAILGDLTVSFTQGATATEDGKAVAPPTVPGQYATPFLSGDNNDNFGPPWWCRPTMRRPTSPAAWSPAR